ncbi:PSD1 and planctomycete cytochrome C domain-containing protein [Candidatus Binatia bacterium]|nr:PSD1 and planctomycete cytochrome C domain-containing protein [Candidatus Binatia bacterium]
MLGGSKWAPAAEAAWPRLASGLAGAIVCSAVLARIAGATASSGAATVDFATQIRPIFEQRCYECHGPHERKGDLRLSNEADAFTPGELGVPVIERGSARLSPLIDLVTESDPKQRMPKDREPLTPHEIDLLRRWIDQGASWPDDANAPHWAYVAPTRPPVPVVKHKEWQRRGLDAFVLARLESEGLEPAPVADPETLLRRVSLDLTGLPPSLAERAEFVRDPSPEAYDRLVDRLLASPDFGERWASEWLDLAHYADSTGFMSEVELSNWPYRDWVIDAINDDMPFDRFTVEQLAGDLLPQSSLEQQVATGFLRAVPLNLEAGVREEDARVAQVIDRVNTVGTTWLGSTIACAQCHDHKYDPVSQVEYYRLLAFFNGTTREAVSFDGAGGVYLVPRGPTIELPQSERAREQSVAIAAELLGDIERGLTEASPGAPPLAPDERGIVLDNAREKGAREAVARSSGVVIARLQKERGEHWWQPWLEATQARIRAGDPTWQPLEIASFESRVHQTVTAQPYRILDDGSLLLEGPPPDQATYVVELRGVPERLTGLRIEMLRDPSLPGGGPGRGSGAGARPFVVSEVGVTSVAPDGEQLVELVSAFASTRLGPTPPASLIDVDATTGWTYTGDELRADQWMVLVPAQEVDTRKTRALRVEIQQLAGDGQLMGRLRISATAAPREIVQMPPKFRERVRDQSIDQLQPYDRTILVTLARQAILPGLNPAFARADRAARTLERRPRAHVIREDTEPRVTHVFERGDHRHPGAEVSPGTPLFLPTMSPELPRDRLGLARWLVSRQNPLTARVVVNRWWAHLFGRGIVATPEDFGVRGDRPTHPELLDYLATAFMDSGWSRKAVLREIVTSATYRQAEVPADGATLQLDPDNRLLSHNPPHRLPAETIRDNALRIAGLLSSKRGGPAVAPPQPPGVWRSNGHTESRYTPSEGEDAYRRGVYTVWRRTTPYPSFVNFDAPDRTACVARRSPSNTPLQALTLLDDTVYVESALAFADRVLREVPNGTSDERLTHAMRIALTRDPSAAEKKLLTGLLDKRLAWAKGDPAAAAAVLEGLPGFEPSSGVDRSELVAWFHVTRVILNLDETINRS